MVSSPVWLIHVMALVPAPKAHWEWLPGPGSVAWARLRACACAVFDCDSNCAAWHFPHTSLPAYPEAVSSPATGMAHPAITSAARHREIMWLLQSPEFFHLRVRFRGVAAPAEMPISSKWRLAG